MGFHEDSEVVVRQEDDKNWLTQAVIRHAGRIESFALTSFG